MNLKEVNQLFKCWFNKHLHVKVELSMDKLEYSDEFLKYFNEHLKNKVIKLEHLIGSEIDNNRWRINECLELIMESIPTIKNLLAEQKECLTIDLKPFFSKRTFKELATFFERLEIMYGIVEDESYAALLFYCEENGIKKNVAELTEALIPDTDEWHF